MRENKKFETDYMCRLLWEVCFQHMHAQKLKDFRVCVES